MEETRIEVEMLPIRNGIGNSLEEKIRKKRIEEENKNPGKSTRQ